MFPDVTGFGEKLALTPFGRLDTLKFTEVVAPLADLPTFTAADPLEPRVTDNDSGEGIVKVAFIVAVTVTEWVRPLASFPVTTML